MQLFKEFILRLSKVKNIPSSLVNIFLLINWKKKVFFKYLKIILLMKSF